MFPEYTEAADVWLWCGNPHRRLKKDEGAILFLLEVAMYGDKLWIGNNGRRAIYAVGESMANTFLCLQIAS